MLDTELLRKGYRIGDWEVLPGKGVLRRDGHEERPEPLVMAVLEALAKRDGELVTRDELVDEVWNGRATTDEPINRSISLLRKHLGDTTRPYRYVQTLTRRGYRLKKPVQLNEASPVDQEVLKAVKARNLGRIWTVVGVIVATLLISVFISGRAPVVPAVAVMPCEFLSDSEDDQYLAYAFQEEVITTLQGAPGLVIKRVQNGYRDLEVSEIGELLDVDTIVFCSLQRDGDMLKIRYHISDVDSGAEIGADGFTGKLEGIFGLQEQFAIMVRKDLLGETEQQLVSRSRPASYQAYDRYLRGLFALDRRSSGTNLDDAIALFEETTRLDPLFGPAYLALAKSYALLPDYRDAPPGESYRRAIDTVERGVAIDESIRGISNMIYGFVYHKQRNPLRAEEAFKKAIQADVIDSTAFNWYARMLAGVGRSDAALEQALTAHRLDPSSSVINTLVATMYIWLNDNDNAAQFFERANQLGAASQYDYFGYALMLMRQGKIAEARDLAKRAPKTAGSTNGWVDPVFAAFADPTQREAAIAVIDEAAQAGALDGRVELALRVFLGDIDGAMRLAKELSGPGTHRPMDILFLAEMRPLREHPGFMELMDMLGVKEYWDENGCMWLEDSVSCPD